MKEKSPVGAEQDLAPHPDEGDQNGTEIIQAWARVCRIRWWVYGVVVALLIALPLIEYARYGQRPQWIFWDLHELQVRDQWKGVLLMGETLFSFMLLSWTGLLALLYYATITRVRPLSHPHRLFWLLCGLGFLWLACDEFFGFHEYIDWRLTQAGVPRPPVGKLKDLIMPGFPAVAGITTFIVFKKAWTPHRNRLPFIGSGVGFLAVSMLFDLLEPVGPFPRRIVEDGAKVLAGTSFLLFYLLTYLDAIGRLLQSAKPAPSPLENHETRGIQQGPPQ